jgi:hypothetical protein
MASGGKEGQEMANAAWNGKTGAWAGFRPLLGCRRRKRLAAWSLRQTKSWALFFKNAQFSRRLQVVSNSATTQWMSKALVKDLTQMHHILGHC